MLASAIRRVSRRYPFHAAVLEQWRLHEQPNLSTVGVTLKDDVVLLLYNSAFVLTTPLAELAGVILHEVHHVVFGHLTTDGCDFPDVWARTVAEEVTCNEFVHEPLPAGAIRLEQFPALPPGESTAVRYARLAQIKDRPSIGQPKSDFGRRRQRRCLGKHCG